MCGIVAIVSNGTPVVRESLEAATRQLFHRGPDGSRTWLSPEGSVGLGHARLSIIDLETGSQPISNEDGTLQLVVNGEFYGYETVREELAERGHVFKTRSDSEILLHLYEDHGFDCLRHLRGEFAFALWDGPRRTLFAARDRFGIKPLCHAQAGGSLFLASEAKALFAAGVPAGWDRQAFFQSVQAIVAPDRTLFDGIHQLPAGHFLVASGGQIRILPYWDFDYPAAEALRIRPEEDCAAELRVKLDEAIRIRLRADVPVGVYLSGGLDSSAIAGIASGCVPRLDIYSVFFPEDAGHNEEAAIRETAARCGAHLNSIEVTGEQVAGHFADAVRQWEDLPRSEWIVGKYLLSRMVRDHGTKVVLTGEGSDEIFAGHLALVRDLARTSGPPPGDPEAAGGSLEGVRRILGYVPSLMIFRELAARKIQPLLSRDFLAEFANEDPFGDLLGQFDFPRQLQGRETLSQSMYIWSKTILQNFFMAACGDRSEMAHSVEGRVPFLDHHLVEWARDLPASMKFRGTTTKHVLREAVRPFVTDAVYRARKKDFVTQPSRIAQPHSAIGRLLQETLRGPEFSSNPFFDRKAVLKLLDDLHSGGSDPGHEWDAALLSILGSCILRQAYRL